MSPSKIEWTDATWNVTTGCDRVSPGCANCYAMKLAARYKANPNMQRLGLYQKDGGRASGPGFGLTLRPEVLDKPLHWKKPRRIFVNSMSDLFHEDIPFDFIDRVFAIMALSPQHTFQVLTKRPARMRKYMRTWPYHRWEKAADAIAGGWHAFAPEPLPNVWLGVSTENQRWADERIPILLDTPAAVRFISVEPMLSSIDLHLPPRWLRRRVDGTEEPGLDWVIVGGESDGPEYRALVEPCITREEHNHVDGRTGWLPKPAALAAVRSLRDQCVAAGVAFFFKQWGGSRPTSGGRLLDGRTWDEYPT